MAVTSSEKILLVESDPAICDLIARQALQPFGYQVYVASDGSNAIRQAVQLQPDVVITNINLPGLSGKDLMVALSSQGMAAPMIVMAEKGQEASIIQAFRLGASDYLILPVREAEVLASVEKALKHVREIRAREMLDTQIKQKNAELQRRVRELSTIFAVGRAVISITDQRVLLAKIIEAVTTVTEADLGWLTLKDEVSKVFLLAAQRNLPEVMAKKMAQPIDDGFSSLVARSAETLSAHGQDLQQFKISSLGKSAMVVPVKVKNEVIGLLTVVRKSEKPFGESEHTLAEGIADYASISLINARLFRALAQNAEAARQGEKQKNELLAHMRQEIQSNLAQALQPLGLLLADHVGPLTPTQKASLEKTQALIKRTTAMISQQGADSKL